MWIKRNSLEGTTIFKKENVQKIDIFNAAYEGDLEEWIVLLSFIGGGTSDQHFNTEAEALEFVFKTGIVDFEELTEFVDREVR